MRKDHIPAKSFSFDALLAWSTPWGYGENKLLMNRHAEFSTRGTWQFWDLFGRIAGTGNQPRTTGAGSSLRARLEWKITTTGATVILWSKRAKAILSQCPTNVKI